MLYLLDSGPTKVSRSYCLPISHLSFGQGVLCNLFSEMSQYLSCGVNCIKCDRKFCYLQFLSQVSMPELAAVSMFPYSAFWRIDGQGFMKNTCGGIATICAIVILVVVSALKLNEVFKMTTIIATSSSAMNLQPPMTNISTVQNDPAFLPYMVGLGFYQDDFYTSSSTASAEYVIITRVNGSRVTNRTTITLENCTINHFSVIPNITQKAAQWGLSNWLCLPLNQTYQIGGSYELSNIYKRIQINVSCDRAENHQDCGYVKQYTLNAAVDPTSPNPSTYFLSQDTFLVKAQSSYTYSSKVNKHTLIVDNSVMPTAKITNTTSTDTNEIVLQQQTIISATILTILNIEVSGRSVTYNRSYLKLLDAISYIGGIFNSILAIFFFIQGFNRYFFEMRFANEYFKTKETKVIDFITFLKSSVYSFIKDTRFQPKTKEWQDIGKHGQIKTIVNKLLDVIYLNKRIAFLEQAISVLFQQHQLKGLHLRHSMNTQEAEKSFHKHRFRERLIYFIHRTKKIKKEDLLLRDENPQSERDQNKKLSDSNPLQQELVKSKQMINDDLGQSGKPYLDESEENGKEMKKFKNGNVSLRSVVKSHLNATEHQVGEENYGGIIHQAEDEYKQAYMLHSPEQRQKKLKNIQILQEEVEYIGEMKTEELKEDELVDQLETDLKKLMQEAENNRNSISYRIYESLDGWLKEELEHVIKQQREEGKFNSLRKTSKIIKKKVSEKNL